MFSTSAQTATTFALALRPAISFMAPVTAPAPPMSHFMSSMPPAGFSEMPPVSKVTPLPISSHGRLVLRPVHPAHDEELRLALAALPDAQQHMHAELLHLGLAQDLDLDAELGQLLGATGELDGIEQVGGLAHQIAREEHGIDRGLELAIGLRAPRPGRSPRR